MKKARNLCHTKTTKATGACSGGFPYTLILFCRQMRTFQRLANQSGERHGNDDGENRVHRARSRFRRKCNRRSLRRTARKHRRNIGLCEIQHNVCQAAADARHNAARYGNGKVFLQHVAGDFYPCAR
mgnify:FL=1